MKILTVNDAKPLSIVERQKLNAYRRAANYLSVGQIYLLDNALLREPLTIKHVKPRLLGYWGTTPGLNFIYAHLNRVIKRDDLNVIYICGLGHGGLGSLSEHFAGRGGNAEIVQTVFVSRRHSVARRSRRRRTRLCADTRLRRGF